MRIKSLAGLVLALALPAAANALPAATTMRINKDLRNLGPDAYDLAIVLEGTRSIASTFDGYEYGPIMGWFNVPSQTIEGNSTVIHWQSFNDGTNTKIDKDQKIHVGFDVPVEDEHRKILDMYWTDAKGRKINGSVVYNATDELTYRYDRWNWVFANAQAAMISVKNVRYAVFPDPLPLDQLSAQNEELAAALLPLSEGFEIGAGDSTSIDLPNSDSITPGSAVVIVYEETGEGSAAVVTNFAEAIIGK